MSLIEIRPEFAKINIEAPPCADITEIHAIVSRIFGEVKDRSLNEDAVCELTVCEQHALVKTLVGDNILDEMCELTFGEQCALVKTIVDDCMRSRENNS